jgi:uncharacterized protein
METERLVLDTNVVISAALVGDSVPAQLIDHAVLACRLLGTEQTVSELLATLFSPGFDRFATRARREAFLRHLEQFVEIVPVVQTVKACRDPRDDKVLEAALNGRADAIISGDKDLLVLHPFAGIAILSPADYLKRVSDKQ